MILNRRAFGATLIPGLAHSAAQLRAERPNGRVKIAAVELVRLQGGRESETGVNAQYQVNPIHVYDELRPPVYADRSLVLKSLPLSQIYLRIRTDAGLDGFYGPIDREAAFVVHDQLRPFLAGKDPLAGEALWDQLYRSNRHSRDGIFLMAISAVDNTLWDLRGRYFETPVYRLLGAPTRPNVEVYGSCLGYSLEPEKVRERCLALRAEGYHAQKWFLAYGPGSGPEGLQKNVDLVRILRETLGPSTDLMFDAYGGWDLNYALSWAKQVEQYRPRWIEEAVHPGKNGVVRGSPSKRVSSGRLRGTLLRPLGSRPLPASRCGFRRSGRSRMVRRHFRTRQNLRRGFPARCPSDSPRPQPARCASCNSQSIAHDVPSG